MIITLICNRFINKAFMYENNLIVEIGTEIKDILDRYTMSVDYICGLFSRTPVPFRSINYALITCYDFDENKIENNDILDPVIIDDKKQFIKIPDIGESAIVKGIFQYNIQMFIPSIISLNNHLTGEMVELIKNID